MRLRATSRYVSDLGRYAPGAEFDIDDAAGELLMRDSPGTFARLDVPPPDPSAEGIETTTHTDLTVPDRRARGGRKR